MIKEKTYKAVVISLIVFIVCGYIFFFLSNFIFPTPRGTAYTQLNTKISINSTTSYTIYEWNYSPEQQKMEVVIEFTTTDYHIVNEYDFQTIIKLKNSQQRLETEIVYNDDNLYIVHINDVPSEFVEVSFRLVDADGNTYKNYTNNSSVDIIDNIQIEDKKSYRIRLINNQIQSLENEIETIQNKIDENLQTIENLNQSISKIKSNQKYEIDEEISKSNNIIKNYQSEIEKLQKSNEEKQKQINQLHEKINAYQNKLSYMENDTLDFVNAVEEIMSKIKNFWNNN